MNKKGHAKVLDNNNAAYVDGFFTYLTSQMLNHHGFINGLDYYGSFLGMKNNFLVNFEQLFRDLRKEVGGKFKFQFESMGIFICLTKKCKNIFV